MIVNFKFSYQMTNGNDNTIQYNTIQYNTIQYNTIQYTTLDFKRVTL